MRAKTIKNAAKVNKEMSVAELKELLDKAKQVPLSFKAPPPIAHVVVC